MLYPHFPGVTKELRKTLENRLPGSTFLYTTRILIGVRTRVKPLSTYLAG